MDSKAYSYTNRRGAVHYFKAAATKKGGTRYYIVKKSKADDTLLTALPEGYEVAELPEDARVVLRKRIPVFVRPKEVELVRQAVADLSSVQDFIITVERGTIAVHISQFNSYHDNSYLSAEEARAVFDKNVDKWKAYDWILSFELLDPKKNHFRVLRRAYVRQPSVVIDEGDDLELLVKKYCPHVGRESMLRFWTPGEDW